MSRTRITKDRKNLLLLIIFGLAQAFAVFSLIQGERSICQFDFDQSLLEEELTDPSIIKEDDKDKDHDYGIIEICFVVSVYGKLVENVEKVQNVTKLPSISKAEGFHFFAYTNLPKLELEKNGWTRIENQFSEYRRDITKSRWPKFLAWKDVRIQSDCQVVFYLDSTGEIIASPRQYRQTAKQILSSSIGHSQYKHPDGDGPWEEFGRVLRSRKDKLKSVQKSREWLLQQPDFSEKCTMYENRYIAYAVNSLSFQRSSQFFWNRYSLELDSVRDQPLWCYTLHHFNVTPVCDGICKSRSSSSSNYYCHHNVL